MPSHLIRLVPAPLHRWLLRRLQPWRLRLWGLLRREVHGTMVLAFDAEGRLLLVRHSYHRSEQWLLPGGGLARGEDPLAAAARELVEETGCRLAEPRLVSAERIAMPSGWHNLIYLVGGTISGTPVGDGREIAEIGLFALDSLPPSTSRMTLAQIEQWRLQQAPSR